MTSTEPAPRRGRVGVGIVIAIAVGIGIGALTAYTQGWLSNGSSSLANSAGPWSLAAFLVARHQRRLVPAVAAAMVTLACCELGYVLATEVRGGATSRSTVVFWITAAIFAGPPIGVAGSWSTQLDRRRGIGFAVIGGVLLGEGAYGWSTIADTTDWRYWAVEAVIGGLIVVGATARARRPVDAAAALAMGLLTAVVVLAAGRLV